MKRTSSNDKFGMVWKLDNIVTLKTKFPIVKITTESSIAEAVFHTTCTATCQGTAKTVFFSA